MTTGAEADTLATEALAARRALAAGDGGAAAEALRRCNCKSNEGAWPATGVVAIPPPARAAAAGDFPPPAPAAIESERLAPAPVAPPPPSLAVTCASIVAIVMRFTVRSEARLYHAWAHFMSSAMARAKHSLLLSRSKEAAAGWPLGGNAGVRCCACCARREPSAEAAETSAAAELWLAVSPLAVFVMLLLLSVVEAPPSAAAPSPAPSAAAATCLGAASSEEAAASPSTTAFSCAAIAFTRSASDWA